MFTPQAFTQRMIKYRLRKAAGAEPGTEFSWCYKRYAGIEHGLHKTDDGCPSCTAEQTPHFRNLVTAKQAVWIYSFAGVTKQRLPKHNETVIFRSSIDDQISFVIRRYRELSVYNGMMFEVMHYRRSQ